MNTGSSVPPQAGLSASCEIRIDNNLSEITRVADMVDDFAARHQFPEQVLFALNVVLDEIINNIISYGYEDAGHHEIAVRVALRPGNVEAVVEDDGKPFDPLAAPAPDLTSAEREPGGVGLHFVRNLMDEVTYTRRDGINHLRMMKRLAP
jgi:anti-sigma regulatory factor (Ser/Thr protein kinase)